MAVRQHVEYDDEKHCGYIDLGPNIDCEYGIIAKEALVFLVNCINGSWKIPIGYFFISGLNAEQKFNMTYFSHPITDRKVIVFLDPCHCVKLLRNCIGEHKSIIDDNGDMIQWEHFTKLNDIQVKESLHLGNKLRTRHIQYHKQKMK
ncbi:uncharacterized protein LOC112589173 [Harpegnathos saltator]|uniref:uncharacterized protein LOC112589173 n=1 Tax=Harpegnathos saltator TaxID=610380 RepID=UPI000DBEDA76|nr:uncharacterized protein LOC112589173 [Harpegnathos saltator]